MNAGGVIVIVEDDEDKAALIVSILRKNLTDTIRHFEDGQAALDYILSEEGKLIKLILLDLILPHVDGIEIFKTIKSNPSRSNIPVMILTTSAQTELYVKSLGLQADGFIHKPTLRNCA